jgi:hypothetical protein
MGASTISYRWEVAPRAIASAPRLVKRALRHPATASSQWPRFRVATAPTADPFQTQSDPLSHKDGVHTEPVIYSDLYQIYLLANVRIHLRDAGGLGEAQRARA